MVIKVLTFKDDLNIDIALRKRWIILARKYHAVVQAFYFTTPVDLCLHNDSFRALAGLEVAHTAYLSHGSVIC
jgi:bifunctional polynucleotide phosphatase/kinase